MLGLGPAPPILSPAMRHAEEPADFSNLLRSQWQFTVQSRSESGSDSKARVLSTVYQATSYRPREGKGEGEITRPVSPEDTNGHPKSYP